MTDLNDPTTWDVPIFPAAVVAQAALVPLATFRQWIVRYADDLELWQPKGSADGAMRSAAKAEGDGLAHMFSLRGALHISAAARLINRGANVKEAYIATTIWAHLGDSQGQTITRLPAGLFADPAWTFLIYHGGIDARVVSVEASGGNLPFAFPDLFSHGHPVRIAPTIVWLNNVDRHVRGVCEGYLRA